MWLIMEENRPPVISDMAPGIGAVITDTTPTFSFVVHDEDRAAGYNDYPTKAIVRVWEKVEGSYRYIGHETAVLADPGAGTGDVPVVVNWTTPLTGGTYGWTVQVDDEIGGISGTGFGGRDPVTEEPDGTNDFILTPGPVAVHVSPTGKVFTKTPTPISFTYISPSGTNSQLMEMRILKLDENNEYVEFRVSPPVAIGSFASGTTFNYRWSNLPFDPLPWGAFYAIEYRFTDLANVVGEWSGRSYFWTNLLPEQVNAVNPGKGIATTSRPLVVFSAFDDDDVQDEDWYPENNAAIPVAIYDDLTPSPTPFFANPSDIAISPDGATLYVADTDNDRIVVLNAATGAYIISINSIPDPQSIAVGEDGRIYFVGSQVISGFSSDSFFAYTPALVFSWGLSIFPALPGAPLTAYEDILYIASRHFQRVIMLDGEDGDDLGYFPPTGKIQSASGLATAESTKYVYVASDADNTVYGYLREDGTLIGEVGGGEGVLDGQFGKPNGMAIGLRTGNLYIADEKLGRVQIFSKWGQYIATLGLPFEEEATLGMLEEPVALAISPDESTLYVLDRAHSRITKFSLLTPALAAPYDLVADVEITGPIAVPNGTFDVDLAGWTYFESHANFTQTISRQTASPRSGAGHARLSFSASAGKRQYWTYMMTGAANFIPVAPGREYTVSMWVRRNNESMNLAAQFTWGNASGIAIGIEEWSTEQAPLRNLWQEIRFSAIAPPGARSLWVGLRGFRRGIFSNPTTIDIDDITMENGVRGVNPATELGGGAAFTYQTTELDIPVHGVYEVRVRGRDVNNGGDWSVPEIFQYVDGPTATILNPEPGEVINTDTPLVEWFLTSGEQWRFKVEALDALTGVNIYDSDWITDPLARSHRIPPGYLADGGNYIARVWIDDSKVQVMV
jgi:YVTN family beta-propeller protein